jgi:uncharacterized membrane protein YjfL (UPF0719 family)
MDIMSSLQGFGSLAIYLAAAIAAEVVFVVLYMAVTLHREATLIKAGNAAAAVSLGDGSSAARRSGPWRCRGGACHLG